MLAAACSPVREVLSGRRRDATLLGVFPAAVYLRLPGPPAGGVLALVTADGVRLPNALVLAQRSADRPFAGMAPGDDAVVGGGRVSAGQLVVEVRRWWRPGAARPVADLDALEYGLERLDAGLAQTAAQTAAQPPPQAGLAPLGPAVEAALTDATADLVGAADEGDLAAAFQAADRMVGLGPGLTPAGDDVLCGFLVAVTQLSPPAAGELRAFAAALGSLVVSRADRATTALSASLLAHAARGEAAAEVVELVGAVGAGAPDSLARALPRLLAVGHTSGRDLATGVRAGARAVAHHLAAHNGHRPGSGP